MQNILKGHLRSIIGKLRPDSLLRERDAFSKVAESVFSSVAAPLVSIDKIEIVDMGGGRGLEQLSFIVPNTVFKTIAAARAQGIDITKLLQMIGVDIDEALKMISHPPGQPASADRAMGEQLQRSKKPQ